MVDTILLTYDASGIQTSNNSATEVVAHFLRTSWKPQHLISKFYKETLRGVISHFGTYKYLDNENKLVDIKCIHSHPERSVAKYFKDNNLILPIISVAQLDSETDILKRKQEHLLVTETMWDNVENRAKRVVSFCPVPVKISYDIHIWTKYKEDIDQITEQIRINFNPALLISTKFSNQIKGFLTQESDNSILEGEDHQDRIIRKTFIMSVETYIPSPKFLMTSTGQIEEYNFEFFID